MSIKTTLQHKAAAFPFSRPVGRIGKNVTYFLLNETSSSIARLRRARREKVNVADLSLAFRQLIFAPRCVIMERK